MSTFSFRPGRMLYTVILVAVIFYLYGLGAAVLGLLLQADLTAN